MKTPVNAQVVSSGSEIPLGAQVLTCRRCYIHHGIYVGEDQVVHYQGLSWTLRRGPVVKVPLPEFSAGRAVHVVRAPASPFTNTEVVDRARSRLGESSYDIVKNNCEHFANWCVSGVAHSPQVERFITAIPPLKPLARTFLSMLNLLSHEAAPGRFRGKPAPNEGVDGMHRNLAFSRAWLSEP